ncbi:hypothetical protein TrLO_g8109 [Triparma laevis f. longispina]|uniref:type II protein arginine methyltransferase n=1 Tax=Triparma laevis f. longispina TaxID=1714387 RepID=A0A9W7E329_9STRA|nr:hypothetical protein TrLO_g8109 [Triparma laevis f. longispina]
MSSSVPPNPILSTTPSSPLCPPAAPFLISEVPPSHLISSASTSSKPSTHVVSKSKPSSTDEEEIIKVEKTRVELETFTQCSSSLLWKLMMSFYDRKGVSSWSQGIVPHFITCNAFIGRAYAKVLAGFIEDLYDAKLTNERLTNSMKLNPEQPLYIIELGTGAGKFSFFMLKALNEMRETVRFPVEKIVYVMTDFTESNFNFWMTHPMLAPYVESGQLDFAIFDAVNDTKIDLHFAKKSISRENPTGNPICVVANYLFDTLCHDIFQVKEGDLKEGLISVGSSRKEEPDPLDPEIIKNFNNLYKYENIETNYYSDGEDADDGIHLERILAWYKDYFGNNDPSEIGASVLFPIGALRALKHLSAMSTGRAFVISGDKGNNNVDQFRGLMDPHIAVHGSFSLMVNYHAIGAYFTSRGGFALHNPQEEASLKVSCFVLPGVNNVGDEEGVAPFMGEGMERLDTERSRKFPRLRQAFNDYAESFGPNDFFIMQKSVKEDAPNPTLKSVVALLKLGDWDPDVFYKFRDTILNQVGTASSKLRNDLCRGIPRIWENYYQLDKEKDVAFEIGRFFYGIRDFAKALRYYTISSETIGEHHVTFHNMGLCFYSLHMPQDAAEHFQKSINLNANYAKAQSWLQKVQKELGTEKPKETDAEKVKGEKSDAGGETNSANNNNPDKELKVEEITEQVGEATVTSEDNTQAS